MRKYRAIARLARMAAECSQQYGHTERCILELADGLCFHDMMSHASRIVSPDGACTKASMPHPSIGMRIILLAAPKSAILVDTLAAVWLSGQLFMLFYPKHAVL